MSRHSFDTRHEGRRIRVVAGYDRPLDEFFLQILRAAPGDDAAPDEFVYTNLYEPGGDWSDPRTLGARLAKLRIAPPESFLPVILEDRRRRIGNRLSVHQFDRAPEIEDF